MERKKEKKEKEKCKNIIKIKEIHKEMTQNLHI